MQRQDKHTPPRPTQLADSDEAVFDLLEALLQEVSDETLTPVETPVSQTPTAEVREIIEQPVETPTETDTVNESKKQPLEQATTEALATDTESIPEQPLPAWTKQPFHCLLVDIEGTEVAIPLVVLHGIAAWEQETVSIPTQPPWHLGVLNYRGDNIVIVDTARLIMPEKITASPEERRINHGSHFLVIDRRWALSCNAIRETLQLSPDQIRWRPRRPTRPWAIGTLIDRLCVLLDSDALMQEIE